MIFRDVFKECTSCLCCDGVLSTFSPKNGRNSVPLTCVLSSPSLCRLDRFHLSLHPAANAQCVTARSPDALLQVQPPSPQPSVDRLSVTFAPEERSFCSDSSVRMNAFAQGSPPASNMEKVHFSREPTVTGCRPSFLCNLSFIVSYFLLYFRLHLFLFIVCAAVLLPPFFLIFQRNDLLFQPFEEEN